MCSNYIHILKEQPGLKSEERTKGAKGRDQGERKVRGRSEWGGGREERGGRDTRGQRVWWDRPGRAACLLPKQVSLGPLAWPRVEGWW